MAKTESLESKVSNLEAAQDDLDDAKRLARHTTSGSAHADPYAPATKEQIELAKKTLDESEATSEVLFSHVGDPLVVEGYAILLGSTGAGSGRGFYARSKGNASASKVAVESGKGGEDTKSGAVATGSSAERAN